MPSTVKRSLNKRRRTEGSARRCRRVTLYRLGRPSGARPDHVGRHDADDDAQDGDAGADDDPGDRPAAILTGVVVLRRLVELHARDAGKADADHGEDDRDDDAGVVAARGDRGRVQRRARRLRA